MTSLSKKIKNETNLIRVNHSNKFYYIIQKCKKEKKNLILYNHALPNIVSV